VKQLAPGRSGRSHARHRSPGNSPVRSHAIRKPREPLPGHVGGKTSGGVFEVGAEWQVRMLLRD